MLAEHGVDIQRAANILGRNNGANFNMRARVGCIDLSHVRARHRIDFASGDRITRDPAPEIGNLAGHAVPVAFAQEVDLRHNDPMVAVMHALCADTGEQPIKANANLDLAAHLSGHRNAGIAMRHQLGQYAGIEGDLRTGPGNFHNKADMVQRIRRFGLPQVARLCLCKLPMPCLIHCRTAFDLRKRPAIGTEGKDIFIMEAVMAPANPGYKRWKTYPANQPSSKDTSTAMAP